jgi:hypothetical protein
LTAKSNGFGYQQTQVMGKDEWLTPPELIKSLGEFDLDPCSPVVRPWDTAKKHYSVQDDGLTAPWDGRVWLNPPYGDQCWGWLNRLHAHGNGIALIFARTGASGFQREVWGKAHSVFFIFGRLYFYHVSGVRAKHNSGSDSVLISYDEKNTEVLKNCSINGKLLIL